jgi:hypothetical protein
MNQRVESNKYNLSIRFQSDGFTLFVSDGNHQNISNKTVKAAISEMSETEIIDLLSKESELQLNYLTVRIICESNCYSFIPYPFFNKEEMTDMLKLQHPILKKTETVLFNLLEAWDAVNIFSVHPALASVLQQVLPEIKIEHHLTAFLTDKIEMHNEKCMHVLIRPEKMDVIVLKENNIQLINTYNYDSPEDFTYYIISIIEQLHLGTEECRVFLHSSEKSKEFCNLIGKYVKNCIIVN